MEEDYGRLGNGMETTAGTAKGKADSVMMAADEGPTSLPSLAITTAKDDATNGDLLVPGRMGRTPSMDIREEREDLKEAAEQTLNVIMDLSLGGIIRWVSPSWKNVIGTPPESVLGKSIAELVLDNKDAFATAVESMKKDDSRSQIIRFSVQMGPLSKLATAPAETPEDLRREENTGNDNRLVLEGQGIMVYDRSSGGESHVSDLRAFYDPANADVASDNVDA
jgi:serine/threonine-protein kinase RIM15